MQNLREEILNREEFLEFDVTFSGKEIIRSTSGESAEGVFWTGPGKALLEDRFLAPTKLATDSQKVTLSQQLVTPTYPAEWTGRMLAESGLAVLELLTSRDGKSIRLNESYSRNFQIFCGEPRWVDLGSFSLQPETAGGINSFQELQFLKNYVIPTHLRSKGMQVQAASLLNVHSLTSMGITETMRLSPVLHLRILAALPGRLKESVALAILAPLWLDRTPHPLQASKLLSRSFSVFTRFIARPLLVARVRRYRKILRRGVTQNATTDWAAYGSRIEKSTPRFDFIQEKITEISPSTVLDVGGNRGYVGFQALERNDIEKYIVLDWDETAINAVNDLAREKKIEQMLGVKYNFANPWTDFQSVHPSSRFSADLVICLALTHHLLLTSQMSYSRLWKSLAEFASADLLVEFMPKGLWSKSGSGYETPDWYSEQKFFDSAMELFTFISRHELEENRVLFHLRRK